MTVLPAEPAHLEALVALSEEIDAFYAETDGVRERRADVAAALWEGRSGSTVLLAWDGEQAVGLAAYTVQWPAPGGLRSLHLKELYVSRRAWRGGAGRALMDAVRAAAVEAGCSRMEWTTDLDNTAAQGFYARLGHQPRPGKLFYRLEL